MIFEIILMGLTLTHVTAEDTIFEIPTSTTNIPGNDIYGYDPIFISNYDEMGNLLKSPATTINLPTISGNSIIENNAEYNFMLWKMKRDML